LTISVSSVVAYAVSVFSSVETFFAFYAESPFMTEMFGVDAHVTVGRGVFIILIAVESSIHFVIVAHSHEGFNAFVFTPDADLVLFEPHVSVLIDEYFLILTEVTVSDMTIAPSEMSFGFEVFRIYAFTFVLK